MFPRAPLWLSNVELAALCLLDRVNTLLLLILTVMSISLSTVYVSSQSLVDVVCINNIAIIGLFCRSAGSYCYRCHSRHHSRLRFSTDRFHLS